MENKLVYLYSLGCDKNQVDAEVILGDLVQNGFLVTDDPNEADLLVVNTCAFIEAAKEESIQAIFEASAVKFETGAKLIVTGCLSERYREDLLEELPEVDAFMGVGETERILNLLELKGKDEKQRLLDGKPYAFIKISEGCDKGCTYCAIPGIRGPHKSRDPEEILREAGVLEKAGVSELIVIAQDITQYGKDLEGPINLSGLLKELSARFDFPWIRLLYLYPEGVDAELLETMRESGNILPYFDIPIQHTNSEILRRMGRGVTKEQLKDKVRLIREVFPEATLRSTVIVGFPGETEEDFSELLEDLKDFNFDRLGAFAYSREEGTPAYGFTGQVDEEVKSERVTELWRRQHQRMRELNLSRVGQVGQALIENEVDDGIYEGRLSSEAPEVDFPIYIYSPRDLDIGLIVPVKITQFLDFEFLGDLYEPTKQADSL